MTAAFLFVAVLLLIGVVLRAGIPLFRWLYIPASVLAGMAGLVAVQFGGERIADWSAVLRDWPGWLIAVVFAGMLLERKPSSFSESASRVGRQGLMVWVIVVGQTALGLLLTWLFIKPFYEVPNSFGSLIETGFAGGHGTAAAMGQVFSHPRIQLEGGLDLGVLMATCGLVFGVVSGILWVNLGVRMGWVGQSPGEISAEASIPSRQEPARTPIGYARVNSAVMDPLLLQVVWLALAMGVGLALQSAMAWGVGEMESAMGMVESTQEDTNAAQTKVQPATDAAASDEVSADSQPVADVVESDGQDDQQDAEKTLSERMSLSSIVGSFPLFIYTLFGGLIVRQGLRVVGYENAIDRPTINRLTATAMDVLVVAAIASLNLTAVATLLVPFSLLFVGGVIWSSICLLYFARRLLPSKHWFELGLINYGMSTGTTATGFVLLRLVDPELESGAAEDYALAAPLSSPFVGGGMITVGLPLLVLEGVPIAASAMVMCLIVAAMIAIGWRWNRSQSSQQSLPTI
ncbi:MAG: sodium/glutamate symporter [Planctomycetota bacterium]